MVASLVARYYLKPDARALSLLQQCDLTMPLLKQIQAHLVTSGAISDPFSSGKLFEFCAISGRGDLEHARLLFRTLPIRSTFVWNTMIRAHVEASQPLVALSVYKLMLSDGFLPNNYTFSFLLRACLDVSSAVDGQKFHSQAIRLGWESYDFVQNGLIYLYATCGCIDLARKLFDHSPYRDVISWTSMVHGYAHDGQIALARELFDKMPVKNAVSWSAMITCYAQFGMFKEALELFNEMQLGGIEPNHAGVVGALTACAFLGALDQGRWIHAYVKKNKIQLDRILGTALIDMYGKCGYIDPAWQVFDAMSERDVFAYTSMISGLSNNGQSDKALDLFKRMQDEDIRPNEVTFICVLSACGRIGLVEEGKAIFGSMNSVYKIQPGVEHYGGLVDLFGRAGFLEEAMRVVKDMPMEPDSYVLGALLNACRVHGNVDLGEVAAWGLEELGLAYSGVHVLLSHIYAANNRWEDVAKIRKGMEVKNVRKIPGCSMIEVNGASVEFVAGDNSHFLMKDILLALKRIDKHLKFFSLDSKTFLFECELELEGGNLQDFS